MPGARLIPTYRGFVEKEQSGKWGSEVMNMLLNIYIYYGSFTHPTPKKLNAKIAVEILLKQMQIW